MRVLACVLVALAASTATAAPAEQRCPHLGGSLSYVANSKAQTMDLARCDTHAGGRLPTRFPRVAGVTTTGATPGVQRLYVHGRLVFSHWETGPLVAVGSSPDGRWVVFFVDEYGGASSIADGTPFYLVSTHGGRVHDLGATVPYPDSLVWCAGQVVWTPGTDRVAIDGKRLLAAAPPEFTPRSLWNDPQRTFGQPDVPPPGWADEQPTWSPDGRSLAFVRERNGYGRVMLRSNGRLFGPLAQLGYAIGYYGHHDWGLRWLP